MFGEEEKLYDLEPTMDFVFKRIFGYDDTKDSLISLLNAILNGNPVVSAVRILNTETLREGPNDKASRLDIEAETDDGTIVNVEVQCVATVDLYSRSIVYASHLITQTMKQKQSYDRPKVISIWIIKNEINHGSVVGRQSPIEEVSYCFIPNNFENEYKKFNDKSRIIWVQLSKFNDKVKDRISEILQEWITFFKNPEDVVTNDDGINKAMYLYDKLSSPEQKKAQIRAQEKYEMDKASEIATARNIGKEEGLKEGKEEGLAEGKHEKALETAKNFLKMELSIEQVASGTGLSIDEVKELT